MIAIRLVDADEWDQATASAGLYIQLSKTIKVVRSDVFRISMGRFHRSQRDLHHQKQPNSSVHQWFRDNKANLLMLILTLAIFTVQEYQYGIGQRILESEISASSRVNADILGGGQAHLQQRPDGAYVAALERPLKDVVSLQACVRVVIIEANGTVESPIVSC
jgi:hypothetical protein